MSVRRDQMIPGCGAALPRGGVRNPLVMEALFLELEPEERVMAAIVRQAIFDMSAVEWGDRCEARAYLAQLGLLDAAGEVGITANTDLWVGMLRIPVEENIIMAVQGKIICARRQGDQIHATMRVKERISGADVVRDYATAVYVGHVPGLGHAEGDAMVVQALIDERAKQIAETAALVELGVNLEGVLVDLGPS